MDDVRVDEQVLAEGEPLVIEDEPHAGHDIGEVEDVIHSRQMRLQRVRHRQVHLEELRGEVNHRLSVVVEQILALPAPEAGCLVGS